MTIVLYEVRVEHIDNRRNRLVVECLSCGHCDIVPPWLLRSKAPLQAKVLNLKPKFRCRKCRERGEVNISVQWERTPGAGVKKLPL